MTPIGFAINGNLKKKNYAVCCARSCATGTCGLLWVVQVKNCHNSVHAQILVRMVENYGEQIE